MITFKRPEMDVELITDYQTMTEAVELANRVKDLRDSSEQYATEAEEGKRVRDVAKLKKELKRKVEAVDAATLVLHLQGLTASQWNMIVLKATVTTPDNRTQTDPYKLLRDALPLMVTSIVWKESKEAEACDADAINALLDEIVDTQWVELLGAVQALNTPKTSVPKTLKDLI